MHQEEILLQQGMDCLRQNDYDGAFSNFQQAAQMGYPVAMNNLSVCYAKGYGTPVNRFEAFRWMKAAAEQGYPDSYYPLAQKYRLGDGTPMDLETALVWAKRAQQDAPEDRPQAQQLIEELNGLMTSNQGQQPLSELDQGIQHYTAGQFQEAFATFKELAEKGLLAAMFNLSVCYGQGAGTAKDPQAAFSWLTKSAEGGYNLAMHNLAVAYATGEGTPKDQQAAFRWMKASAEAGDSSSYYPLACKYAFGTGTPVDLVQALDWARKAAQVADDQQPKAQGLVKQLESDSRLQQAMRAESAEYDMDLDDER